MDKNWLDLNLTFMTFTGHAFYRNFYQLFVLCLHSGGKQYLWTANSTDVEAVTVYCRLLSQIYLSDPDKEPLSQREVLPDYNAGWHPWTEESKNKVKDCTLPFPKGSWTKLETKKYICIFVWMIALCHHDNRVLLCGYYGVLGGLLPAQVKIKSSLTSVYDIVVLRNGLSPSLQVNGIFISTSIINVSSNHL